jgi:uncharacterized membrane protein YozB (DUF420 family)
MPDSFRLFSHRQLKGGRNMKPSVFTLLMYVFALVPGMLLGFYFARRKLFFPQHKYVMTTVTIVNWILILFLMVASYRTLVLPYNILEDVRRIVPTIHLITGGIAQLLATYLVILMWTERTRFEKILPYRIKKIKTPMRITLGLWLVTIALGVVIFAMWYPTALSGGDAPVVTEEPASTEEPSSTESAEASAEPAMTESAEASAEPAMTESAEASAEPASTESAEATTEPASTESAEASAEPAMTEEATPATTETP